MIVFASKIDLTCNPSLSPTPTKTTDFPLVGKVILVLLKFNTDSIPKQLKISLAINKLMNL